MIGVKCIYRDEFDSFILHIVLSDGIEGTGEPKGEFIGERTESDVDMVESANSFI